MPVEDHVVHEATKHGGEFRYGCQTSQRVGGYYVLTRNFVAIGYDLKDELVIDNSSKECRYMDYEKDTGCTDCPREKDWEYINKMRVLK